MGIEFRQLKPEEVEVRVNQCTDKGCSLLLYKTSRIDMDLLDETFGPENWQKDYKSIDGKLFCGIGVNVDGEWIWKWDTGTPSNMEAQKGEASDAAKRAGFVWGIGRELYTAPRIWVGADKLKNHCKNEKGRWQCYDDFRVTEMDVADGRIFNLQVCNMSKKGIVVYGREAGKQDGAANAKLREAYRRMGKAIEDYCARHGITDEAEIQKKKDGVKKRPEWETQSKSADWIESVAREFEESDG